MKRIIYTSRLDQKCFFFVFVLGNSKYILLHVMTQNDNQMKEEKQILFSFYIYLRIFTHLKYIRYIFNNSIRYTSL